MPVKIDYFTVSERDMDMLFANSFACDVGFLNLFLQKVKIDAKSKTVLSVELSKTDATFGESDITVIAEIDGKKVGILIEDKINAVAMSEQCKRYFERGQIGIKNKEYESFYVFLVAPKKYYEANEEAKKYDNFVSYEECKSYFESVNTTESLLKVQQLSQALEKAKRQSNINFDENRNKFLREYIKYQKEHFQNINCTSNSETAGTGLWTYFAVSPKNALIYHKTNLECVDLTFHNSLSKEVYFDVVEKYISKMGFENVKPVGTGKSMSFRIKVPKISFDQPFEECNKNDLDKCFEACEKLTELAKIISYFAKICE